MIPTKYLSPELLETTSGIQNLDRQIAKSEAANRRLLYVLIFMLGVLAGQIVNLLIICR